MTILSWKTNPAGPASMDIQIEQGCDIGWSGTLYSAPAVPLNLTGYTITAEFSPAWTPGAKPIPFTVLITNAALGTISISLPGSVTASPGFTLPAPPRKTAGDWKAQNFDLGGWILTMTDATGFTTRLITGRVRLQRDPTAGG
jgi:hypothetical protein